MTIKKKLQHQNFLVYIYSEFYVRWRCEIYIFFSFIGSVDSAILTVGNNGS